MSEYIVDLAEYRGRAETIKGVKSQLWREDNQGGWTMNRLTDNTLRYEAIGRMLDYIVGQIAPQADTNGDDESQSNLNAFGVVCDWIARKLIEAGKYSDSQFYSAQVTARRTFQQAAYLGETVLDYHYDNDWLKEYRNE